MTKSLTLSKLCQLRQELEARHFDRDSEIEGLLVALLARQHILLLGPPGTGKSNLASDLCGAIAKARFFRRLLTRTTNAEEVLGVVPPKTLLESEDYIRKTTGKLPECHIGFLDEIFKCNSVGLNALLSIANERIFDNGSTPQQCPLVTLIGASNELPDEDENLEALNDRFLLRYWVDQLDDPNTFERFLVMVAEGSRPPMTTQLTLNELGELQIQAASLPISGDAIAALGRLKLALAEEEIQISTRAWGQCLGLLRAKALLDGADEVTEQHLGILAHVLWKAPEDRETVARVLKIAGNVLELKAAELLAAAKSEVEAVSSHRKQTQVWAEAMASAIANVKAVEQELETLLGKGQTTANCDRILVQIKTIRESLVSQISEFWQKPVQKPVTQGAKK